MGNRWWGIVLQQNYISADPKLEQELVAATPSPIAVPTDHPELTSDTTHPSRPTMLEPEAETVLSTIAPIYLDADQRYQWWPRLDSEPEVGTLLRQGQVLDCQPLRLNTIKLLTDNLQTELEEIDLSDPAMLTVHLQKMSLELATSSELFIPTIPTAAYVHLGLYLQFPYILPELHDTWQQTDPGSGVLQEIYVVSDRSSLPPLSEYWRDESLPPSQLLRWLDEMTDLWDAFAAWGCCSSLMDVSNLRVEEEQFLCLQRLIQQPTDVSLSIKELVAVWLELFSLAAPPHQQSFAPLQAQLESEQIADIAQLQAWLTEAATQLSGVTSVQTDSHGVSLDKSALTTSSLSLASGGDIPTLILPNQLIQLEVVGQTNTGRDRHHNEDYFLIHHQLQQQITPAGQQVQADGLYILCDGMGGHAQGEVASCLAAETLYQFFESHSPPEWGQQEELITAAILAANQALFSKNEQQSRSGVGRMGTTLVMLLLHNTQVWVAHVGDSRLYRVSRRRDLEQITLDHEVGQRDILRGVDPEIAYARPDAYQLTQALGPRDEQFIRPQIQAFEIDEDSVLLLCSDGLTDNNFLEQHYQSHLKPMLSTETNLDQATQALINLANQHNGHDNITVVTLRLRVQSQLSLFL